jgi:glycosyltransferase involved in cell wall biosynthesis
MIPAHQPRSPLSKARTFAFVTTCKGRLHHLQQTLPLWVSQAPDQIVVVDYGCPQGTGDWVESTYPDVTVVRVADDETFSASRARNKGAAQVTAEWICFIDADVRTHPSLLPWLRAHVRDGCFYLWKNQSVTSFYDVWGTFVCERRAHHWAGGYDEVIRGWGCEDADFYHRLQLAGVTRRYYPGQWIAPIQHDDTDRVDGSAAARRRSEVSNRLYFEAKKCYLSAFGRTRDLPVEQRIQLMQSVTDSINAQAAGEVLPNWTVDISLSGYFGGLREPLHIKKQIRLTMTVESRREG